MQLFKVTANALGNTVYALGQATQDTASLLSLIVGDEGLKHTTRQSFKIINTSLDESAEIAVVEKDLNLREFRKKHKMNAQGRPPKS
jgi:hypothetical protein